LIPLSISAVALGVMGYTIWWFVHYLDRRSQKPDAAVTSALDSAQIAEEQRRLAEQKTLERLLARLTVKPTDLAANQELDNWLDSPAGKRMDLSSDANLGLAQHLILIKDRWDAGLRRLALTSDGPWRSAAEADFAAGAGNAPAAVSAGDRWWKLAETVPAAVRPRLQARAGTWYSRALPQLNGAEADRVRRRLEAITGPRRQA